MITIRKGDEVFVDNNVYEGVCTAAGAKYISILWTIDGIVSDKPARYQAYTVLSMLDSGFWYLFSETL